ncbi:MAG TPA: amidohydrolase [Alcanivorax sp.]|jgi:imidazolonepropionase-like amidohydrolase|nr:amidohydrolase [Haliea sp.]HAM76845.1 amidohydrolase [Alcanivorax sp.]|tara:strand:+ start:9878 stop:11239 length:1362 start_codon:yes stop_codon:yes gene_type:complete
MLKQAFAALVLLGASGALQAATAFPSTYTPAESQPTLLRNATVLTGDGQRLEQANLLMSGGKIEWVGQGDVPPGTQEIDATGRWVTPGLIDVHSHLGVYPSPSVDAHQDGNEMSDPVTANIWAEHSVWPQDPGFGKALAGGVTSLQILPGSANLFGGRGVTLKNVYSTSYQGMKFPGAPYGLKMACGENPKRVYGQRNKLPSTRMGNVAHYRAEWIAARDYIDRWARYDAQVEAGDEEATAPLRDLKLETLAGVLQGEIIIHMHCYRADEMMTILSLAEEFDYRIGTFHHAVEAYKIADELAEKQVCGALWADWWGFKMEAYDGIQENIALVDRPPGGCAVVHSDSAEGIQRLNQEAAKAMGKGRRAGMTIEPEHAIGWITANAARSLGIESMTGSLAPGKMADVVVWSGNPFSVYSKADLVFVDGALLFDRDDPARQPVSDFELGQLQGVKQ